MKFERLESLSDKVLMELLPGHINQIEPGLRILADRLSLSKEDKPFILVTRIREKRLGIIEVLSDESEFPGIILSHSNWVAANQMAISTLKNETFDFEFLPFVICLVRKSPSWLPLCPYLKIDVSLVKYQPLSFQGSTVLLFEPLGDAPKNVKRSMPPADQPLVEKIIPGFSTPETVNEMGLTEAEVRYFTS